MVEGYMLVDGYDVSKSLNHKPSDQTKKPEGKGFDISRLIAGFQERSFGSKVSNMKDTVKSDRNQEKVVDSVVEDKTMKSVISEDKGVYTDGDVRCEELLVKAGRKYKLALSIDGDGMRALYNWGLALSFRAQLIAYIGPASTVSQYMNKEKQINML
ncbi:hypothetical protein Hdeb2414_s0004g00147611 [Helianthus debilis subsp. tardiflorus]